MKTKPDPNTVFLSASEEEVLSRLPLAVQRLSKGLHVRLERNGDDYCKLLVRSRKRLRTIKSKSILDLISECFPSFRLAPNGRSFTWKNPRHHLGGDMNCADPDRIAFYPQYGRLILDWWG